MTNRFDASWPTERVEYIDDQQPRFFEGNIPDPNFLDSFVDLFTLPEGLDLYRPTIDPLARQIQAEERMRRHFTKAIHAFESELSQENT